MNILQREGAGLKHRWPRIVTLLTCLAMTLVVAQQGGTITIQQNLIRVLWGDSKQLNNLRVQELAKQREKATLIEPQPVAPEQKPPAAKAPARRPKSSPRAQSPRPESEKPPRVLWQI